ncbi:MAG: choice-of-anchor tandem repeat GloVer-containing protein [Candidatus Tumulicola sp.]
MHSRIAAAAIAFTVIILAGCSSQSNPTSGNGLTPSLRSQPGALMQPSNVGQESTLYVFQGKPDAGGAFGGLLAGSNGEFYGASFQGGTKNRGAVYQVSSSGAEQVLYSFKGGSDGSGSESDLIAGSGGVLYGVTLYGGSNSTCPISYGCGTVFEMVPNGSGYSEHVLYAFKGPPDGVSPIGSLLLDKSGALYGTTNYGGTATTATCISVLGVGGCGTVFKLTPAGSGFSEKILYSFQGGSDGENPKGTLIADAKGALYGTTQFGGGTSGCYPISTGDTSCGTVFKLLPSGAEKILYRFQGGADGGNPRAALLDGKSGGDKRPRPLFGVTQFGGSTTACNYGCGTAFELMPAKSGYTERIIHNFSITPGDGHGPSDQDGLIADASGDLFGTTISGGKGGSIKCGCGTVFELTPSGSGYTETLLHSFKGAPEGWSVRASLTADASGTLYGTTFLGGDKQSRCHARCGVVFKVSP